MTVAKERPTFRIVENPSPSEIDYESFKVDFNNPFMTVDEIRKKYDLSPSRWNEYRKRAMDDLGLSRKPCYTYGKLRYVCDSNGEYIQKKSNGYIIVKKFGRKSKYYGRYADYDTAKMVRDELVKCDWNMNIGAMLMDKYSIARRSLPSLETAKLLYPDFKELYFHSPLSIRKILKELRIGRMTYSYLVKMIREDTGVTHRPKERDIR